MADLVTFIIGMHVIALKPVFTIIKSWPAYIPLSIPLTLQSVV